MPRSRFCAAKGFPFQILPEKPLIPMMNWVYWISWMTFRCAYQIGRAHV
jgi:hypothetical protein